MLSTIKIEFEQNENLKLNFNAGSVMHGALMEVINPEYAEYLHQNDIRPYSQYLMKDRNTNNYVWKISTLTKDARKEIIEPFLSANMNKIYLKHNDTTLNIKTKTILKDISYKDLANNYMVEREPQKRFVIKFLTPTTFKTQGHYLNYPQIHNIYSNLLSKWNYFSKEISLNDKDTQTHLINYTQIGGYKMRSTKYSLEKVKINSFMGGLCLFVNGPLTLVSIANLLFAFSEFSGIGAKTALGMGGCEIE